ncbi:MAG: ribokinase [Francisellaceae bacterium]|jgi:ribokinase
MKKNKKVLTIGGATIDTIIKYEEMETLQVHKSNVVNSFLLLEEGAKIEVTEQERFSGGGATNAAVSFKKQGYDVTFFGKVGKDALGERIINELNELDIDTNNVQFSNTFGTANSYVVPSLQGDRTVFAYRGANTNLLESDIPESAIAQSDFVYVTSLSKNSAARLPKIVQIANNYNIPVAINPGISQLVLGSSFVKSALSGIDILILNYDEAKVFMTSLISSDESIKDMMAHGEGSPAESLLDASVEYQDVSFSLRHFFKEVLGLGPKIVVVTNGSEGVYVGTTESLYFHESIKCDVLNTLGAGDAFGSTFVGSIYAGLDVPVAIKHGLINSGSVISFSDAKTGLLDWNQIKAKVSDIDASLLKITDW